MLSTKNIITDVNDIPKEWIFSYYSNIDIKRFDGNNFNINSVFNTKDNTPSLFFWVSEKGYRFNDFSTGIKGTAIDFVMNLYKISFLDAVNKIKKDYINWCSNNKEIININYTVKPKYHVGDYTIRKWNTLDRDFWLQFNISSNILNRFKVHPISQYFLTNENGGFYIKNDYLYGYFKDNNVLYKIYQPFIKEMKFVKVESYIQGSEQIGNHPYLIYTSSLKDIMSLYSLNLTIDYKAPDSENTLISESIIKKDLENYKKVFTFFDVDEPGIKAANKYKDLYNIQSLFLNYGEKDPSDHIKVLGVKKAAPLIITLINKHLNL